MHRINRFLATTMVSTAAAFGAGTASADQLYYVLDYMTVGPNGNYSGPMVGVTVDATINPLGLDTAVITFDSLRQGNTVFLFDRVGVNALGPFSDPPAPSAVASNAYKRLPVPLTEFNFDATPTVGIDTNGASNPNFKFNGFGFYNVEVEPGNGYQGSVSQIIITLTGNWFSAANVLTQNAELHTFAAHVAPCITPTATSFACSNTSPGTFDVVGGPNGSGDVPVPIPAAVWLFGSGLLGLIGIARRRRTA